MSKSHEECFAYLEQLRWGGKPTCPYCNTMNATPIRKEHRYHCNYCFSSFSVTVGTPFHKTHVQLQKWFCAIALLLDLQRSVSVRQLAKEIGVHKNTAAFMINRINRAMLEDSNLMQEIARFYRTGEKRQ